MSTGNTYARLGLFEPVADVQGRDIFILIPMMHPSSPPGWQHTVPIFGIAGLKMVCSAGKIGRAHV